MSKDELMVCLKKLGGTHGSMSRVCEDGQLLYSVLSGRDGQVHVSIRCGEDIVFARAEDVAYIGRTVKGLKVHLRCGDKNLVYLTLSSGRKERNLKETRSRKTG